ncbi:MAG: sulfate ABC transporter permease subunit CysW, partial [Gemmataceae bacterium]
MKVEIPSFVEPRTAFRRGGKSSEPAGGTRGAADDGESPEAFRSALAPVRTVSKDHWLVRWSLTLAAISVLMVLVVVPVVHVFYEALSEGVGVYWDNLFADADTRHAILLTLIVAPTAVACNVIFGVAAAWVIARFHFPGRTLLTSFIDLPFSVSPVVAGLIFVLIFGLQGYLGPWLRA